jgi:xanthine dehydrogenase accessory factor
MNQLDQQVLQSCVSWLGQGKRVALVTVVQSWGSSPRPMGSLFAVSDAGDFTGSVSGGCIEDDLLRRFAADFPRRIELVRYGISAEEMRRFGLPCGGTLELSIEPLADAATIAPLLDAVRAGRLVQRRLELASGKVTIETAACDGVLQLSETELVQVFGPRWRLLMIGAGQVSEALNRMAPALGFSVSLCDPREEQRLNWQGGEVNWLDGMPDDAVLAFRPDQRTVIVTLSHDPKIDDMALMEALKTDAFYIGAIGSKASTRARRARLEMLDVSREQVDRLHAPIGLSIGSRAPAEIAVAIMAELIQLRSQAATRQQGASFCATGKPAAKAGMLETVGVFAGVAA